MDKNFDELIDAFKNRVYSVGKGEIRLSLLKYDIETNLPQVLQSKSLKILDAGGGMGQMTSWLSSKGHDTVLCDISSKMLEEAQKLFNKINLSNKPQIYNEPIQKLPDLFDKNSFDLILLHGVIEWMDKPFEAIDTLLPLLKKGGNMSILVHNLDKTILKWGINGQYENALSGKPRSVRKLTPFNSLSCNSMENFFVKKDCLKLISKAGIRIFHGFFSKLTKDVCSDTFQLEKKYCHIEPFASLGEHTHYILLKI